jgi:hypothetical protein
VGQPRKFDGNWNESIAFGKFGYTSCGFSDVQKSDRRGLADKTLNAKEELAEIG